MDLDLERGITVLDAGCGSGRWLLDMAQDYPNSTFVGVDQEEVSPMSDVPSNCNFMRGNILNLPFADNTFDFTFQRLLLFAFTPAEWEIAVSELVRVTKPGGWVELFEASPQLERAPPEETYWRECE